MKALHLQLSKHQIKMRFLAVGLWNTLFGYCSFYLLDTFFSHILETRYIAYMSAMVLAQVVAIANAYLTHKRITFRSRVKGKAIMREVFKFSLTYAFTFCLNLILLPILVEIFHIAPKISGIILIVFTSVVSYVGHSRFTFQQ